MTTVTCCVVRWYSVIFTVTWSDESWVDPADLIGRFFTVCQMTHFYGCVMRDRNTTESSDCHVIWRAVTWSPQSSRDHQNHHSVFDHVIWSFIGDYSLVVVLWLSGAEQQQQQQSSNTISHQQQSVWVITCLVTWVQSRDLEMCDIAVVVIRDSQTLLASGRLSSDSLFDHVIWICDRVHLRTSRDSASRRMSTGYEQNSAEHSSHMLPTVLAAETYQEVTSGLPQVSSVCSVCFRAFTVVWIFTIV